MTGAAVALAFASALCFGVALVLTHIGLRYIPPLPGAAISIPSLTLLFIMIAPIVLGGRPIVWAAMPIFAAVGLLYPAALLDRRTDFEPLSGGNLQPSIIALMIHSGRCFQCLHRIVLFR